MASGAVISSGAFGARWAPPSAGGEATQDVSATIPLAVAGVAAPALARLPLPEATPVVVQETAATVTALAPKLDAPVEVRRYVVEPGDSVRTIAHQFGITNETLIWENDLTDPDMLQVGYELRVLPFSGLIHEVRPGDTVASVANSYEALVGDVIRSNRLSEPYIIVVGQRLAVPGGYRPLPQRVIIVPSRGPDTVQAPPSPEGGLVAAVVLTPPKRTFPVLGSTPQEQFIGSIAEAAVDSADRTGVPASVTLAQAILESYWGSSRLAREANNYFGIKAQTRAGSAGSVWFDVWEVIGGRNVRQNQAFRAYHVLEDSFVDHGRFFMENGRYAAAMAVRHDPRQFAREINRAGYATDPAYAAKLIALMDRYDLYRYDDV